MQSREFTVVIGLWTTSLTILHSFKFACTKYVVELNRAADALRMRAKL